MSIQAASVDNKTADNSSQTAEKTQENAENNNDSQSSSKENGSKAQTPSLPVLSKQTLSAKASSVHTSVIVKPKVHKDTEIF